MLERTKKNNVEETYHLLFLGLFCLLALVRRKVVLSGDFTLSFRFSRIYVEMEKQL